MSSALESEAIRRSLARLHSQRGSSPTGAPAMPPEPTSDMSYPERVARRGARSALGGAFGATPPGIAMGGLGLAGAGLEGIREQTGGALFGGQPAAQAMAEVAAASPYEDFIDIETLGAAVPPGEQLQMVGQAPSRLLEYLIGGGAPESPSESVAQAALAGASGGGVMAGMGMLGPVAGVGAGALSGAIDEKLEEQGAPWYLRLPASMMPFVFFGGGRSPAAAVSEEAAALGAAGREDLHQAARLAGQESAAQEKAAQESQRLLDVERGRVLGLGKETLPDTMTSHLRDRSLRLLEAGERDASAALRDAEKVLSEGSAFASDEARQALKKKYRLTSPVGYGAIDPLSVARDLRGRTQRARAEAYEPLRERYQAWDAQHGGQSILIEAEEAAQLKNTAEQLLQETRSSATAATDDVLKAMLWDSAEAANSLKRVMDSIAEGGASLPLPTRDLRAALTSLKEMTRELLPGDPSRRIKLLENKLDGWLQRHPNKGAYQELKKLNQDYSQFKKSFEGNRLMRPLLDDYLPVERAVDGLKTAEVGELLEKSIGSDGLEDLVRFRLSDVLEMEPEQALKALPRDRVLGRIMPKSEYRQLVNSLKEEGKRTTAESLLRAQNHVERALEKPNLTPAARDALEETQRDLNRRLGRFRSPEVAEARRAIQRASRMRDREIAALAEKEAVKGDYSKVVEALDSQIPLSELTPERVGELLATAGRHSGKAYDATARALLDRFLGDARTPQLLLERVAEHGEIIQSLIGKSHAEQLTHVLPRLAEFIETMPEKQMRSLLETVAQKASTRQARQWAQAAFKGTRSYLKASLLQGSITGLMEWWATGKAKSALVDALEQGRAPRPAYIAAILNASQLSPRTSIEEPSEEKGPRRGVDEARLREKIRERLRGSTPQP